MSGPTDPPDPPPVAPPPLGPPLAIAPAGPAHAALLGALHAAAFADPAVAGPAWDAAAFARLLAMPGCTALIAADAAGAGEEMGEPLGLVLLRTAADEAEILTLATRPEVRRRGVARALLAAAQAAARRSGAERLFLEVAAGNAAAVALYGQAGFARVGLRRGYYVLPGGGRSDALVMACPLR